MALADAPSATKTSEKPRMKASDESTTCGARPAAPATATAAAAGDRCAAHVVERQARDVRQVARDQRQDAGRDERQQPGAERRQQRDVFFHAGSTVAAAVLFHRLQRNVRRPCGGMPSICTLWPFTGGRSWNMKSHFHRSDGFDACSQLRAGTGRVNASWSASAYGVPGIAAAIARRTSFELWYGSVRPSDRADVDEDLPVLARFARRRDRARRRLHAALVVGVDRVLLDVRRARQHDVGRRGERRSSPRPGRSAAAACRFCRAVDDPRHIAERAVRARDRARTAP